MEICYVPFLTLTSFFVSPLTLLKKHGKKRVLNSCMHRKITLHPRNERVEAPIFIHRWVIYFPFCNSVCLWIISTANDQYQLRYQF
jgi:hypothetical protein